MKPIEIANLAITAKLEGRQVYLVIPKGKTPRGFPRGKLASEICRNGRIERVLWFDPDKLLSWLIRNGLITMERRGERGLVFSAVEGPE